MSNGNSIDAININSNSNNSSSSHNINSNTASGLISIEASKKNLLETRFTQQYASPPANPFSLSASISVDDENAQNQNLGSLNRTSSLGSSINYAASDNNSFSNNNNDEHNSNNNIAANSSISTNNTGGSNVIDNDLIVEFNAANTSGSRKRVSIENGLNAQSQAEGGSNSNNGNSNSRLSKIMKSGGEDYLDSGLSNPSSSCLEGKNSSKVNQSIMSFFKPQTLSTSGNQVGLLSGSLSGNTIQSDNNSSNSNSNNNNNSSSSSSSEPSLSSAEVVILDQINANPEPLASPPSNNNNNNNSNKNKNFFSTKVASSIGTNNSSKPISNIASAGNNSSLKQLEANYAALNSEKLELKKQFEQTKISRDQAEFKLNRTELDLKSCEDKFNNEQSKNNKLRKLLEQTYRESAVNELRRRREKLSSDCVRLGKISSIRISATAFGDVFEDGYALKELAQKTIELAYKKEELEKRRKRSLQVKRQVKRSNSSGHADEYDDEMDLEILAEVEAIRTHSEQVKKEEHSLAEERRVIESEKAVHMKELKRCQFEERSRFYKDLPLLHERYQLLMLLGKGGFSEVWKAMDMTDLKEVAVKVHQLNPSWTEEKKHSYIKHVTREYTIHREMKHPRVVQLYEVFEIDVNSFATVLEYCRGIDLDEKLKRMKFIPEKDAKAILLQILSGLKYLNTPSDISPSADNGAHPRDAVSSRRKAVIHFDLKPANILFDEMGDAKITDFGLSKIIEDTMDNDATSLELTTQGAGTYWYLPPECFQAENSRISPKVDVWSLGVIFYQVLFGKRPFGDGKTQERVMSEGIMLNATKVEFPSASDPKNPNLPKVSEEAKDFIKYCLTWDQKLRPDINQLCMHPYVRNSK